MEGFGKERFDALLERKEHEERQAIEHKDEPLTKFCAFCGVPTKNEEYCDSCLFHAHEGPPCACGLASKRWLCKKEGPTQGSYFYTCAKDLDAVDRCAFYELQGGPKWVAPEKSDDKCYCPGNPPAVIQVTRKSTKKENIGRKFVTCANKLSGCNYFRWYSSKATKLDKLRGARAEANAQPQHLD